MASLLLLSAFLAACGREEATPAPPPRPTAGNGDVSAAPAADLPVVAFLGDSLTAGYGLPASQAYPALVERALREAGTPVTVMNAGVSGDTTAGGRERIGWLLAREPDVVVVALGANDGLRALPPEEIEANLREIVGRVRRSGAKVLLLGMRLPPNYGRDYVRAFEAVFPRVAEEEDVPYVPFLLEGVAGRADLNQDDGIHPNARGQEILAETVLPELRELLSRP